MFRDQSDQAQQTLYDYLGQEPELYAGFSRSSDAPDRMGRLVNNALMTYNEKSQQAEYIVRVSGGRWIISREAYDLWNVRDAQGDLHEIMLGKLWLFIEKSIKKYERSVRQQQRQQRQKPKPSKPDPADQPGVQTSMDLD
jgi:hypothetical protein